MILLDTCVVSEAIRPSPSESVLAWMDSLQEDRVFLPSLVMAELHKGVQMLSAGTKRSALDLWLEQLRERFQGRILSFDEESALAWGSLVARLEKQGRMLPLVDSMLAAMALQHQAILATRNTKDYEDSGAVVLNPWEFSA